MFFSTALGAKTTLFYHVVDCCHTYHLQTSITDFQMSKLKCSEHTKCC